MQDTAAQSSWTNYPLSQDNAAGKFIIYRCIMNVPNNSMFVTPGENRDDQKVTTNISDIVYVYLANNNHWVMVHLDIEEWHIPCLTSIQVPNKSMG